MHTPPRRNQDEVREKRSFKGIRSTYFRLFVCYTRNVTSESEAK